MSSSNSSHCKVMDNIEDRLHRYRAKRLRFLINGDKFFTGINYALNTEKIRSFDALLNELTQTLMDNIKLCKGVRYIFSIDGKLITALNEFQDGNNYICSSIDTLITTEYRINHGKLNWLVRNSACISSSGNIGVKRQTNHATINNTSNQGANNSRLTPSTPTIRIKTSHNNGSVKQHNITNNSDNNQSGNHQTKSPIPNRRNPNSIPVDKKTPKKSVEPKINHSTPKIKNPNASNGNRSKPPISEQHLDIKNSSSPFDEEINEKYDVGRPIGDGHFSLVYCCMNKANQEFYALKVIDKLKCRGRDDMIYTEVKILKQLSHPNIVKLIEEFDHSKFLYLILELVQDGDLFDAISTVTKFDEVHVSTMIYNLSSALTYLHKQGVVHRDIKPENLLISVHEDGSQSVKLADFGLAVEVGESPLYSVCGTAFYVSPEMLNETGYDYKVDVWSTGVICFILLCGYPPFTSENENNQDELFDAILAGDFQFAPQYWSKISQHAKDLIKRMLTVEPEQRYTAEQVFTDSWTMGTSSNFDGIDPMNVSRRIASLSQNQ